MELVDKETQRFENFVLMIENEISAELKEQSNKFKSPELKIELKREETRALIKVIVIKTMVNLQKKRAFNSEFINHILGRKVL